MHNTLSERAARFITCDMQQLCMHRVSCPVLCTYNALSDRAARFITRDLLKQLYTTALYFFLTLSLSVLYMYNTLSDRAARFIARDLLK